MISSKKIIACSVVYFLCFFSPAYAATFTIKNIRIDGMQHVPRETILNDIPVRVGGVIDDDSAAQTVHALYETGFFSDVKLDREEDTLVIRVVERPVIGSININGNDVIEKSKLEEVLKSAGLVEGRMYNPAILERFRQGLIAEYHQRGHSTAEVNVQVKTQPDNRVDVSVNISEGNITKVKKITLVGNHAYSTRRLLWEIPLSTGGPLSFFTHDHYYSEEKFNASLDALQNFYMDGGYIRFHIVDKSVRFSEDHSKAFITIKVDEGSLYTIGDIHFSGELVLPEETLRHQITFKTGEPFSKKALLISSKNIGKLLGNEGYMFVEINTLPQFDEKNKRVSLTFVIHPGRRVYVRRIIFSGNMRTADEVLRREARQFEGGVASIQKIREVSHRLRLLGYFQHVRVKTLPVQDHPDQVDLQYQVEEMPAGGANVGVGYGTNGFVLNAGINQSNFLGTGTSLGISLDHSALSQSYNLHYNNPYYTDTGIQRGFSAYSTKYTPGKLNITYYSFDTYGGSVNFSIPVSPQNDFLQISAGYQGTALSLGNSPSRELVNFVTDNGSCGTSFCRTVFQQALLSVGWTRNSLDRVLFPNRGLNQMLGFQVTAPVGASPLSYYKAQYSIHGYHPLFYSLGIAASAAAAYGNGIGSTSGLPFFQNFYAGGIGILGAVRGYDTNSLGPRDSNGNPLGGNLLTVGSVSLILPPFAGQDKLRTTAFIDAGNVYNTRLSIEPPYYPNQHAGPVRFSAGLGIEWRVPMLGIVSFSLAKTLNPLSSRPSLPGLPAVPGDNVQPFQFTFGTSLT